MMAADKGAPFRPIANPYVAGNPIEDRHMFFGREDDFEYIRKKIVGGKKGGLLVLCGTRRSGKTSILYQIKGGRLGEKFIPVLIDMQSMTVQSDSEFLAKLAREIIVSVDCDDISYERDYLELSADNPYNAFQALIQVLSSRLPDKKLILLFDEYELFETHVEKNRFSTDILHLLANWIEHSSGVFIVFTGSDKLEARPRNCWEHFLGKALHRRISFLSRDDTFRLIKEPVHGRIVYDSGVVEAIYLLTAGQPFYTQVLCQSLVDHLNEEQRSRVIAADIEMVTGELIDHPLPQMIFSWSSLSDVEKLCLSCMAELNKSNPGPLGLREIVGFPIDKETGYRFDEQKLHETCERLFHYDLLTKEQDEDRFGFKMDLWRRWVGRMHSIWQVINEITEDGRVVGDGILTGSGRRRWPILTVIGLVICIVAYIGLGWPPFDRSDPTKQQQVEVFVHPDSSWVNITTEPSGATARLGDRFLEETPQKLRRVLAGDFVLNVELDGYRAVTDTLCLVAEDTLYWHRTLAEITGGLDIRSQPLGAAITLDGVETEYVTPRTIQGLSAGSQHQIQLSLSGYYSVPIPNVIVVGDSVVAVYEPLVRIRHTLTVRSDPDSAVVFLDGEETGTTLFTSALHEGSHTVHLRKDGYHDWRRTIELRGDTVLTAELDRLPPGRLVVLIKYYADIWVNGELKAQERPRWWGDFAPGTYHIELNNYPGYEPLICDVELRSGEADTIRWQFDESENGK